MAANSPLQLGKKSQDGIIRFNKSCQDLASKNSSMRTFMEQIDKAYQREKDTSYDTQQSRLALMNGDISKIRNTDVPIIMPQVETAVAYQSSVFLSGNPLFGVVSSEEYMDAAMQLESIIDNQSVRGGWTRDLILFFRDGFKYNLSALELTWDEIITPAFETDLGRTDNQAKVTEVTWSGNILRRLDPYNLIFDTRVVPYDIPTKGEFAGYIEVMSRVALKQFIAKLTNKMNIAAAFDSRWQDDLYYVPQVNIEPLVQGNPTKIGTNWSSWFSGSEDRRTINYADSYLVKTLYGRIIPSDFGIITPASNTPQVWKFIIVNESVLVYAERQTNAHEKIPLLFGSPLEDGLGYQTKSFAKNVEPIQEVSSALMTSVLDARRRAISDRTLYDPTRIRSADINSNNPSAKIPVRPSAYNKNLAEAVYPFPFRDDQSGVILQQLPLFNSFAESVTGQNRATQGQFVKGNKTLHEYSDVMSRANGRSQTISMLYEAQVFTPLKEIAKLNVLQYQGGTSVYSRNKNTMVKVDPVVLRKAIIEFKVSDGLIPSDKLINGESYATALQVLGSAPNIAGEYKLGRLFSYLMKTQGADISEFEKSPQELQYEQAVSQWQQTVLQAMKDNPQLMQNQLPPQPTPDQFGLGKDGKPTETKSEQQPTIYEQFANIQQQGDGDAS